jgi:hypothetical protein
VSIIMTLVVGEQLEIFWLLYFLRLGPIRKETIWKFPLNPVTFMKKSS